MVFFMAAKNSKRDAYAIRSKPFVVIQWLYVTRRDTHFSTDDFSQLQFAANLGSARITWLEEQHKKGKLSKEPHAVDTVDQSIKMVTNRRAEVALMNNLDLEKSIRNLSIDSLILQTYVAKETSTGLYFSRAFLEINPGFLDEFNTYLDGCMERE